MAAKRTAEVTPLGHPVAVTYVGVELAIDEAAGGLSVTCHTETHAETGVEMEALTGAQAALLTLYDRAKARERGMTINDPGLTHKRGGRSGNWQRPKT